MLRFFLLFWALTQVQSWVVGQSPLRLQTQLSGAEWTDVPKTFPDSTALGEYLANWQADQQAQANWEASVDTLYRHSPTLFRAKLHRGPAYIWQRLLPPTPQVPNSSTPQLLKKAGYRQRRFRPGRRFSPEQWTALRDTLLVEAAARGYPFASVGLDSVEWVAPGALSARIALELGPQFRVGDVRVPETVRVRPVFLQRYLGLRPGEVYRDDRVRRIAQRLNQLPYVSVRGSPKITFQDSLAFLDLPVERRPASRFDFVIGVLPASPQNGGKLLITGELNGELYNGFGQGERIAARFEQLRPQTQELALALDYPFLFSLPFGFEGELDLYRRDSSFLNLNWRLAATYLREGNDRLSVFWENRRTIVPGQDQGNDPTPLALTDTLGVSRSFFGLQARRVRTDRRFAPRSGYAFHFSAGAGTRRLLDVPMADSLNLNRGQLKIEGGLDLYADPLSGTVFYVGLQGAGLFSAGEVLANEQYRLGGARLLRGFDEQSVFARDYVVATIELRLLLGGNAYLYGFLDAGRVNGRSVAKSDLAIDYPLGFGAGVNFDTRAGVFGLSLALGRSNGIPLDIGTPKVHLGYVSVF